SRRRHTRFSRDWSSDVCSSDLTECLSRDRTRHQVAEVTSLGLVQMTRKRVGTGLLEAFSTTCEHCKGRGVIVSTDPHRGNGHGNGHHGSRRSRNKSKAGEQHGTKAAEQAAQGPTPEQRESAVSAVQAMANASKVALTKTSESESDAERADRSGEDTRTTVEAQPDESAAVDGQRNGAVPVRPEEEAASTLSSVAKTSTSAEESAEDRPESTADGQREQRPTTTAAAAVSEPAVRTVRRPRRAAVRPAGPPVPARDDG